MIHHGPPSSVGFTLIETAVGLALGGTVILVATAVVTAIPDLGSPSARRLEELRHAVAVRREVRTWLRGAIVDPDPGSEAVFEGLDGPAGSGTDAIRIVTGAAGGASGGRTAVQLRVDPGEGGLVAIVRPGGRRPYRLGLDPAVTGLEVRYLYRVSGELRWFDGWSSRVERPFAVQLRATGVESTTPLLGLPLTVRLGG